LRSIVAAAKVNSDLERVGDLAVNIAEATQRYLSHSPVKTLVDILRMAELAQAMLHDALDSFVSHNIATAQSVLAR
jgi:phosphate transport system protein